MTEIHDTVAICNARGLHARAAAKFVKMAESFKAEIMVEKDGSTVTGDCIMDLLMLGAAKGSEIRISATGPDAEKAVKALTALVCEKFGEDH